jgi:hypothetical protein
MRCGVKKVDCTVRVVWNNRKLSSRSVINYNRFSTRAHAYTVMHKTHKGKIPVTLSSRRWLNRREVWQINRDGKVERYACLRQHLAHNRRPPRVKVPPSIRRGLGNERSSLMLHETMISVREPWTCWFAHRRFIEKLTLIRAAEPKTRIFWLTVSSQKIPTDPA